MKKIFIAIALVSCSYFSYAQSTQVFSTKVFKPDVYIGANTGINIFVGEDYRSYLFTKPFSALGFIERGNIGYNINPIVGVRGNFGFTNHKWPHTDTTSNILTTSEFSAAHFTIDFTYNLSNKFLSYDLKRPFDISLFAGAGILLPFPSNDFTTDPFSFLVHGGLQADYRLTHFLDLNLIGDINVVPDNYNGDINGFPFDIFPALSVGITYHFRKRQHCNCAYMW